MRGRIGADRGRREALTLAAVLSIGALVLSAFGVLERGETQPPQSRTLESMSTRPDARWRVDAASLFGKDFDDASVSVEAADDHLLVRASRNRLGRPSAVIAIDPDTGRPLWRAPRIGWENSCAISRDKRLACTRMARAGSAIVTRVSFGDRYVVTVVDEFSEDLSNTRRWTVLDARSGSRISGFTAGFGQGFVGFDGARLILGGEADADQRPSNPALSAYDIRTGVRLWHLPAPRTTAHWQVVAGHLLLVDDGVDAGTRSSIVGYAA